MPSYHLKKDGTPGLCRAQKGKCPLDPNAPHFASKEEARKAFEQQTATFNAERKVADQTLEERYFERMAASLGDKSKLVKYLPPITDPSSPPTVLDIGAGGGEFAHILSGAGYEVTALDANEDAIERMAYRYPDLHLVKALANHSHDLGTEIYDSVVASSILHEVYSYGDDVHRMGHISSIDRALQSFYKALKPGGKLVIRDGVKPANWDEPAEIEMLDGHENSSVQKYLDMCPFSNGAAYDEQGRQVSLEHVEGKKWRGNLKSCMEFSYTYTWGEDSFPRETQELYAPLTLNEYKELLEKNGFELEESTSYLQEGYPKFLGSKIRLTQNGKEIPWPDSNAIWVARKI